MKIKKIRCPRCKQPPEALIDHGYQSQTFFVSADGTEREDEGYIHEGDIFKLTARCKCGHRWRIRGAVQVTCIDVTD